MFCVPGESYLAVLDALHDAPIAVTVCRQEGGAAMMADATARLTGRPGIAMVTRGPGATNASHGIHIAEQDSAPMILFVGQVERGMRERDAFQEIDYRAVFGSHGEVGGRDRRCRAHPRDRLARLPRRPCRAGPGPVVIALPEDMLLESAARGRRPARRAGRDLARPHPDGGAAEAALGGRAARS